MFINSFKEGELKLLWRFYASTFISGMFFIFAAYWVVYFKEIFNFTQIAALLAIMNITPLIFEVPTGVFADVYGRKPSTLLGVFIMGILFILIAFTNNYFFLIMMFITFGFAGALISGADNAWAVDKLIYYNRKDLRKTYFQRKAILINLGLFFAAFIGMGLVKYLPFNYIWIISGVGLLLSAIFLVFEKEQFERKSDTFKQAVQKFIHTTKKGIIFTKNHRPIKLIISSITLLFVFWSFSNISWEPELINLGLQKELLGLVTLILAITGFLMASNYHIILKKLGRKTTIMIAIFFYSIFSVVAFFVFSPYVFLSLLAIKNGFWEGFLHPVYYEYLHKFYVSEIRATLESISNLIISAFVAIFGILGGVLNDAFGPRIMILSTGILTLTAIIPIKLIKKKPIKS